MVQRPHRSKLTRLVLEFLCTLTQDFIVYVQLWRPGMYIEPHTHVQAERRCMCNQKGSPSASRCISKCFPNLIISLIVLTQPIEARYVTSAIEISIPHLLWQDFSRHTSLPIPLRRTFSGPSPVKPSPRRLIGAHLCLSVRQ